MPSVELVEGLEPATARLQGECSTKLSYTSVAEEASESEPGRRNRLLNRHMMPDPHQRFKLIGPKKIFENSPRFFSRKGVCYSAGIVRVRLQK